MFSNQTFILNKLPTKENIDAASVNKSRCNWDISYLWVKVDIYSSLHFISTNKLCGFKHNQNDMTLIYEAVLQLICV